MAIFKRRASGSQGNPASVSGSAQVTEARAGPDGPPVGEHECGEMCYVLSSCGHYVIQRGQPEPPVTPGGKFSCCQRSARMRSCGRGTR